MALELLRDMNLRESPTQVARHIDGIMARAQFTVFVIESLRRIFPLGTVTDFLSVRLFFRNADIGVRDVTDFIAIADFMEQPHPAIPGIRTLRNRRYSLIA